MGPSASVSSPRAEVDAVWARLVAAASAAPEEEWEEEPEEVGDDGEDSPERREGSTAADIRVCARVWRKEGEGDLGVGWIACGGGGCGSTCVVEPPTAGSELLCDVVMRLMAEWLPGSHFANPMISNEFSLLFIREMKQDIEE